jgi:hypothetical protein
MKKILYVLLTIALYSCALINSVGSNTDTPTNNEAIPNADYTFFKTSSTYLTKTQILAMPGYSVSGSYGANEYVIGDDVVYSPGPTPHKIVTGALSIVYYDQWFMYSKGVRGSVVAFTSVVSGAECIEGSFYWNSEPTSGSQPNELSITVNGDFRAYSGDISLVTISATPTTSFTIPTSMVNISSTQLTVFFDGNIPTTYNTINTYKQFVFEIEAAY